MDGQGSKRQRKIAENSNRLSRVHQRYRQTDDRQTDGTAIAYSEREREFTFAKNWRTIWPNSWFGSDVLCCSSEPSMLGVGLESCFVLPRQTAPLQLFTFLVCETSLTATVWLPCSEWITCETMRKYRNDSLIMNTNRYISNNRILHNNTSAGTV